MKITKAAEGLKEIVKFIKNNDLKEVIVDPKTATFIVDGFVSSGMEDDGSSRMRHSSVTQICDLGFCIISMDPMLTTSQIKYTKDGKEEVLEIEFDGIMF